MLTRKVLRNVLSNMTGYVVTAVVGFSLTPFVVRSLGDTGYGVWTLILSMTGYFGLLDLGIRSSVGRFVTRYVALEDHDNVRRVASTAFSMLALAGAVAFVLTLALATYGLPAFKLAPEQAQSARIALIVMGVTMGGLLPFGVFSSILIALERFDVLSAVTICTELARAATVVYLLSHGYGIVALAVAALILASLQYTVFVLLARRLYPPLALRRSDVRRSTATDLFNFSIYRFLWIIANQVIFYSDALVIGYFLGAAAITPFAIAASLINYGRNIVSLATDTLYPAAARLDATANRAGLQDLLVFGTRLSLLLALPLCLGLVSLGEQFLRLWVGDAHASSAAILSVLTVPQLTSMSQYTSALILAGMARHRVLAYFVLAEAAFNVILSALLARSLGVIGVAWGTAIPHLLTSAVLLPLYTMHVLGIRWTEYLSRAYVRPLLSVAPAAVLGFVFSFTHKVSWGVFLAEALSLLAVFLTTAYFVCLDAGERSLVTSKALAFLRIEATAV